MELIRHVCDIFCSASFRGETEDGLNRRSFSVALTERLVACKTTRSADSSSASDTGLTRLHCLASFVLLDLFLKHISENLLLEFFCQNISKKTYRRKLIS
jgi:hypothetical protein